MANTYESLDALLAADNQEKNYFNALPDYVREQIRTRGSNVNSTRSLMDYAENLLRGDN